MSEAQEAYKTLTHDGVEFIEKEAFHDAMNAAESIIQDHVYILKRMEGRHAEGRMALYGDAYKRLLNTVMRWTAFKEALLGESQDEALGDVEKEQGTTIITGA